MNGMKHPMNIAAASQLEAHRPGESQTRREPHIVATPSSDATNMVELNSSVVLISPDEAGRRNLRRALEAQRATILREFAVYPSYAHLPAILDFDSDAFIVEMDSDPDIAMDLVEAVCTRKPSATVMVYSASHDGGQMVRSMRAGAREFLTGPILLTELREALGRAAARRLDQTSKKTRGKLMVFWGAKGGSGVTTLATNFAIGLRMETGAEVALLDLNPDLGDVAVLLGVTPRFTVAEALQNSKRLDHDFVTTLMTSHASGISILAAPDSYNPSVHSESRTVGKLMDVIGNEYPYVVIDAGRGLGDGIEPLFQMADTIYLVTQLNIPSLRNTQRFISHIQREGERHIELVVNRFDPRNTEFDNERVAKVLGMQPKWKIPNDYSAVHRSSNAGNPLILEKSPVANALRTMARVAAGRPGAAAKKKSWGLFS
jgi:pilus assembly protein CpaE